jgi:transposase-like protein
MIDSEDETTTSYPEPETTMATATKKMASLQVSCPFCHDEDATISMDLNQVGTIRCSSCDEEFTARQACDRLVAELDRWEKVARLVEMATALAAE